VTTPTLTTLRIEVDEATAVATVTLDRPDRLNALSRVLLGELVHACRWLDEQPELKVVVVRGAGRAFSGGFDLADFATPSEEHSVRDTADLGRLAAEALAGIRQLTVAAVHGHCVGGGVVLVSCCDVRVAADDARFVIPEVDLGIPLAWGGIPRLVRELGPALTKELVLTCRPFDAAEAVAWRFVNRVVARDALEHEVRTLAEVLAAKPGFALRTTKQQVDAVMEEIAGTGRSANDADTLVAAVADPESVAAARRYLERRAAG
jgi:enoyl-CoA hydratase/carnithine racemase